MGARKGWKGLKGRAGAVPQTSEMGSRYGPGQEWTPPAGSFPGCQEGKGRMNE